MGGKEVRELLEALPVRALISGWYVDECGGVCAVGALVADLLTPGHFDKPETLDLDVDGENYGVYEFFHALGEGHVGRGLVWQRFRDLGVTQRELEALQAENDRWVRGAAEETDAARYQRVLAWVKEEEAKTTTT